MAPIRFSVLGDSISTFRGYNPPGCHTFYPREENGVTRVEDMWWYRVKEETGWEIDTIDAFSGSRVTDTNPLRPVKSHFASRERLTRLSGDLIFIHGGVNDYASDFSPPSSDYFAGTYRAMARSLKALSVRSVICLMTPLRMFESVETKNRAGVSLADIRAIILSIAKEENLPSFDLFPLDPNEVLAANLHPTKAGMKLMSEAIVSHAREIFPL